MNSLTGRQILDLKMVGKPWGRTRLPLPFAAPEGKRIGEIWFEPPPQLCQLLVKCIFTSEKLSVQVHPTDEQAQAASETDRGGGGKEECWLIIDAEPGAVLGVGFRKSVTAEEMRSAAHDGSIEGLLAWHPVQAGDFFYIPANTVHAIGAGISLIEVQQNADITFRLYDYDRPRELHVDEAVKIADGTVIDPALYFSVSDAGSVELADGQYFQLHRAEGPVTSDLAKVYSGPALIIPLDEGTRLRGGLLAHGNCAYADGISDLELSIGAKCLLVRPKLNTPGFCDKARCNHRPCVRPQTAR